MKPSTIMIKPVVAYLDIRSPFSRGHQLRRGVWTVVYHVLFRTSPRPCHAWRRMLLRCFGAKIAGTARVYGSVRIWAPWNLRIGEHSVVGAHVDCYCVAPIQIGSHTVVSQYSFLCTASHDIHDPGFPLIASPITIGNHAWVAADAFVGPGVNIGDGAVVGARSSVFRDVSAWTVVVGNPAAFLKHRTLAAGEGVAEPSGVTERPRNERYPASHR